MSRTKAQARCEDEVSFEYFCCLGEYCTVEKIEKAITSIMSDYPEHDVYIGITHHPCGRYTGNYTDSFKHPKFPLTEALTKPNLLTEKAHYLDYEMMFVICYTKSEFDIRSNEVNGIAHAKKIDKERVHNSNPGGNGNLSVDKKNHYFIYVCITKTKVIEG